MICFWGNCIWVGWGKISLVQKEFLSSPVTVLTNGPKISDITNRDIFQLNFPQGDDKNDKNAVVQIQAKFGTI